MSPSGGQLYRPRILRRKSHCRVRSSHLPWCGLAVQFSLKQRQASDGSRELFGVIDARAGTEQVSLKPIR
jgi:hypothetical protein